MVPPYSTGNWSGLIYFSKTSFQFAGRRGKEGEKKKRISTRQDFITAQAVYTQEAEQNLSAPAHQTRALGAQDVHTALQEVQDGPSPRGLPYAVPGNKSRVMSPWPLASWST